MARIADITRRGFILGSSAIAGGVAFGAYFWNKPAPNPLADGLEHGAATFNPWVKIDGRRITLIAPHTDLGQGVRSLQAMLIAEELDLDPGQFEVETGPPATAYFNAAAGDEMLPDPSDKSLRARFAVGAFATVARNAGLQITGGSSTVPDSFVKLREAGAIARETLKLAAARQHGVPVDKLSTRGGTVVLPDGKAIPYTALAQQAAAIEPVRAVTLRDPSQWRMIGKETQRLDIVAKSTGTLTYGIDLSRDGMVHAAIRLNPYRGGSLKRFNAKQAMVIPGVRQVIEIENGIAAIADNSWTAMQAALAVEIEWADGDHLPDMAGQWDAIGKAFGDAPQTVSRNDGDVDQALSGGATVAGEYRIPYLAHAPLEPLGALIHVTDDRADIWVASQVPIFAKNFVSEITGVSPDRTFLHNQYVGGSFGHRLEFDNIRYAAEIGKKLKGTPVKLTYSREEDMAQDYPRPAAASRFRAMVKAGQVKALDIAVSGPSVMASQGSRLGLPSLGPDAQFHAGISNAPYALEHMRVRAHAVDKCPPTSSWRSVGASGNGFFLECALDEAIHAAGADPLAERLRLCNSEHAAAVLKAVGEMSGWGEPLEPKRGRGIALVVSFGTPVAEVVEVTDTGNGIRIDKVFVAANVGPVLDPVNIDNLIKGGVIWGLGHAINCEITYQNGAAQQTNYHAHEGMRLYQCPEIQVRCVQSGKRISGIGEPPVPPAPAALGNAIFAATSKRLREMPFNRHLKFV